MKRKLRCQNAQCGIEFPRLQVGFCPYCGSVQAIDEADAEDEDVVEVTNPATEPTRSHASVAPVPRIAGAVGAGGDAIARFSAHIAAELPGQYCDETSFIALLAYGTKVCGLPESRAEHVLTMQLEKSRIVNERNLLLELDGLLRNFTDRDKKLDKKEWADAVDSACRPRGGCATGLKRVEAERYITEFCRRHGVKAQAGFFRWAIP